MDMISANDVINAVEQYLKYDSFAWRTVYADEIDAMSGAAKIPPEVHS